MLISTSETVSVFPLTKRRPVKTLMAAVTEEVKMRQYLWYLDMVFLYLLLCIHTLFQHYRYKNICHHWQSYSYKNVWLMVCVFIISKQLGSLNNVSLHNHHSRVCIIIWAKAPKYLMAGLFVFLKWKWIFIH